MAYINQKSRLRTNTDHDDLPFLLQKLHYDEDLNIFRTLFENRQCSFREPEFQRLRLKCNLN